MAHLADIGVSNFSQANEIGWAAPQVDESQSDVTELVAYVDGGCLGNPGPSGIGVVISGLAQGPVRIAKWIGNQDNNVAEYAALMEALQYAVALKARKLHVYSDSQVVVRQMTGEYGAAAPGSIPCIGLARNWRGR